MIHGPFPVVRWQLFGGLPMLLLGGFMLLFVSVPAALRCDVPAQTCRIERSLVHTPQIPYSSLRGVQVVKDGRLFKPVLQLSPAAPIGLGPALNGQAHSFADRVNAALRGRESFEVTLARPWPLIVMFVLITASGAFLTYLALRGVGSYRIGVGAGALAVQQRILGFPVSRSTVSTQDVRRVELEYSREPGAIDPSDQRARLVLVTADGTRRPLSARTHYGHALHLRAAEELRALLGL